jgi:hypothetical protein
MRITPKAKVLIQDHVSRIREVITFLWQSKGMIPDDAHGRAQCAGNESPLYKLVLDKLFDEVEFERAVVREAIIATIAACFGWDCDPELAHLPNPWFPLLHLYLLGYPVSSESTPDGKSISLLVGLRGGIRSFQIIES